MTDPADAPPPHPSDDLAASLAMAMVSIRVMFGPVIEAVIGYRRSMIEAGFTPGRAETMALEYHGVLIAVMRKAMA